LFDPAKKAFIGQQGKNGQNVLFSPSLWLIGHSDFMKEDIKKAPPMSTTNDVPRATRDWFLILLTGSAGSIDAAIFLKSQVFTANMSGNTVILGLALARLESRSITMTLFALSGFCFGAALAAWIVKALGSGRSWSHRLNRPLRLAAVILLAGGVAGSLPSQSAIPVAIALTAAAMGIQSASIQHLAVSGISTNVVTSTLTAAVTRLVNVLPFSHPAGTKIEGPQLHLSCWCSYLLGAVVGGVTSQIGLSIPFGLSVFLVLAVVTLSQHATKQT
jgi:uncharacterized membrane protein YoaK (UPF0700 family)